MLNMLLDRLPMLEQAMLVADDTAERLIMSESHDVLIIGGGSAGLTVGAQLRSRPDAPAVTIIEPSAKHHYQPLWTLVGGGIFPREDSERNEADFIPPGATWIQDAVATIDPVAHTVRTASGQELPYEQLVVAAGLQLDWTALPGLADSVGKPGTGVVSNYSYDTVASTWEVTRTFRGGTAIFTETKTPVKCGGAPKKIMYLAEESFRRQGVRDKTRVLFMNAKASNFTAPAYGATFRRLCAERGIELLLEHELVGIRPEAREAVFRLADGSTIVEHYDMMHVTPAQSTPDFLKHSPLIGDGRIRLHQDPQGVVPVRPESGALEYVRAQGLRVAEALLACHAARTHVVRRQTRWSRAVGLPVRRTG